MIVLTFGQTSLTENWKYQNSFLFKPINDKLSAKISEQSSIILSSSSDCQASRFCANKTKELEQSVLQIVEKNVTETTKKNNFILSDSLITQKTKNVKKTKKSY